jgi:hypothetical protein
MSCRRYGLFHRALQVVVSEESKNSTKIMEGVLVGVEKRLLRCAMIGAMVRGTAHHAAKREHLQLDPLAAQLRPRLIPTQSAWPFCPGA